MIYCVALLAVLALNAADGQGTSVNGTTECDVKEALDTQSLLQARIKVESEDSAQLTCPRGTRGSGGTCNCALAPGYDSTWTGPWCYEGKCYAGTADRRCRGKPPNAFGGSLGDGTWCFGERRDTECPTSDGSVSGGDDDDDDDDDSGSKQITCDAGERGPGGTCDCNGSPGYDASWQGPWCYEGKAYAGLDGYSRCRGKPPNQFGGSLGDGTWCYGPRRDTECKCTPAVSGGDDDDDDDGKGPCDDDCKGVPEGQLARSCQKLFRKTCDEHFKTFERIDDKRKANMEMRKAVNKIAKDVKKSYRGRENRGIRGEIEKCRKCNVALFK